MNGETTVLGKRGLSVVELGRLIHINEMVHLDQFKCKCIFIVNHDSEVFFTPNYIIAFLLQYNCNAVHMKEGRRREPANT